MTRCLRGAWRSRPGPPGVFPTLGRRRERPARLGAGLRRSRARELVPEVLPDRRRRRAASPAGSRRRRRPVSTSRATSGGARRRRGRPAGGRRRSRRQRRAVLHRRRWTRHAEPHRGTPSPSVDRRPPLPGQPRCASTRTRSRAVGADAGPTFFAGRYTIGVWAWEVEEFPRALRRRPAPRRRGLGRQPLRPATRIAPRHRQAGARPPAPGRDAAGRRRAGPRPRSACPTASLFLFVFDYLSVLERKNPLGLVEAFRRAFRAGRGAVAGHQDHQRRPRRTDRERLRARRGARSDILLIEDYLPAPSGSRLMAAATATSRCTARRASA